MYKRKSDHLGGPSSPGTYAGEDGDEGDTKIDTAGSLSPLSVIGQDRPKGIRVASLRKKRAKVEPMENIEIENDKEEDIPQEVMATVTDVEMVEEEGDNSIVFNGESDGEAGNEMESNKVVRVWDDAPPQPTTPEEKEEQRALARRYLKAQQQKSDKGKEKRVSDFVTNFEIYYKVWEDSKKGQEGACLLLKSRVDEESYNSHSAHYFTIFAINRSHLLPDTLLGTPPAGFHVRTNEINVTLI